MGWRSFLFGFATLVALGIAALAQDVGEALVRLNVQALQNTTEKQVETRQITAVQLPSRAIPAVPRGSEGTGQPYYMAMIPATAPQAEPVAITEPQASLRPSEDGRYRLAAGDTLRVSVFNEDDLSGAFAIDPQGFIRLPLIGQVQAAGLTTAALESRLTEAFVKGGYLIKPRVSVEIASYRPVYVLGEVKKPGEYPYADAMTAPKAIALAGGYTDAAAENSVLIRHDGEKTERSYRADEYTRLHPGDVMRVERSTYWALMTYLSPLLTPFAIVGYILK